MSWVARHLARRHTDVHQAVRRQSADALGEVHRRLDVTLPATRCRHVGGGCTASAAARTPVPPGMTSPAASDRRARLCPHRWHCRMPAWRMQPHPGPVHTAQPSPCRRVNVLVDRGAPVHGSQVPHEALWRGHADFRTPRAPADTASEGSRFLRHLPVERRGGHRRAGRWQLGVFTRVRCRVRLRCCVFRHCGRATHLG